MITTFDAYGILHNKPVDGGDPETSENGLLFSAVYLIMLTRLGNDTREITDAMSTCWSVGNQEWTATPISKKGTHLSHDNCLGIKVFMYLAGLHLNKSMWPKPRPGWSFIPAQIITDRLLKNGRSNSLLWVLKKISNLSPLSSGTSGQQLTFVRWHLLWIAGIISYKELNEFLIKGKLAYWWEVFHIYYLRNINHPIVIEWEECMNKYLGSLK